MCIEPYGVYRRNVTVGFVGICRSCDCSESIGTRSSIAFLLGRLCFSVTPKQLLRYLPRHCVLALTAIEVASTWTLSFQAELYYQFLCTRREVKF